MSDTITLPRKVVNDARFITMAYAAANPKWGWKGSEQDPAGAHALYATLVAALAIMADPSVCDIDDLVAGVNYEPIHKFATDNRVSYNELCTAVHQAVAHWQPIETAPKDGSKFLVWAGAVSTACYKKGYSEAYGLFSNNLSAWIGKPTHWMPLPKGPV